MALARGARKVQKSENIEVEEILTKENKVVGVRCGDTSIKEKYHTYGWSLVSRNCKTNELSPALCLRTLLRCN